jgi:heme oxygenase
MAENTAFVTGFFRGISNQATFVQLVTSLWFVYDAMEGAFDTTQDETVKAMDFPALRRLQVAATLQRGPVQM